MNDPAARAAPVVLFDFDGTLLRGDTMGRLLRQLLAEHAWRRALALCSLPLLLAFAWWRTAWLAVSWFSWLATVGRSDAELAARRAAYVAGCVARRDRLRLAQAWSALQAHVDAGDRVVIVTGCESAFTAALWRALGGPEVAVVGSRTRRRFGGEVAAFHCFGARKLRALAEHGLQPPFAAMYSDSAHDLPLLRLAEQPVLVSDDAALRRRLAARLPGLRHLPAG